MDDIKFYHEKFETFCAKLRWSKTALAKECGVTRQCVTLWAKGIVVPSETKIRMLARILGISPNDISSIEASFPVSEKNINPVVSKWGSYINSDRQGRSAKTSFFLKEITSYYSEHEQFYLITKALMDSMQSILYIKDKTLKYSIANKAFLDNLSLDPDYKVDRKSDLDFFPKEEAVENEKEDFKVFNSGKVIINSERFIYGSRKKKLGLVSKYPIMDENKQVLGVLANIVDISELKKFEIIQKLINEALSKLDITVSITNTSKHYVIYYTGSIEEVFGIDSKLDGKTAQEYFLSDIVHPDDREEQKKYYESSKFPPVREYRIIHPKKGLRKIRATAYTIKKGNENYFVSLSMDIT